MEELATISIGIGLVVSLLFSEVLGAAAGGMVVPGYVALYLHQPLIVILTMAVSYVTYFTVHSLSTTMILYGRRRTVLMILVGFMMGAAVRYLGGMLIAPTPISATPALMETPSIDLNIVGYIIPGLIAIWIDRQGAIETFSSLITASVIVRLSLILITGGEMLI